MAVTAQQIADEAAAKLFDPGFNRHLKSDHLDWINDGQCAACFFKPDISVQRNTLDLVAGIYQSISATAHTLIKPLQNMGADGATPGPPVRIVDMDRFTLRNPSWMQAAADATVLVVMFDASDPEHFHVYPPQPAIVPGKILAIEGVLPAEITAITGPITINAIYRQLLVAYDLFRAYSIDAKHSRTGKAAAMEQWNFFVAGLGRKDLVEKTVDPNVYRRKAAAS